MENISNFFKGEEMHESIVKYLKERWQGTGGSHL
jgi:hypothetical protein